MRIGGNRDPREDPTATATPKGGKPRGCFSQVLASTPSNIATRTPHISRSGHERTCFAWHKDVHPGRRQPQLRNPKPRAVRDCKWVAGALGRNVRDVPTALSPSLHNRSLTLSRSQVVDASESHRREGSRLATRFRAHNSNRTITSLGGPRAIGLSRDHDRRALQSAGHAAQVGGATRLLGIERQPLQLLSALRRPLPRLASSREPIPRTCALPCRVEASRSFLARHRH